MSPKCLPSLGSIRLSVQKRLWHEAFKDGCRGGVLGYRNGTNLAILNLYVAPMPPMTFPSKQLTVWKVMSFEEFRDGHQGGHL